jgi:hypothetical protein
MLLVGPSAGPGLIGLEGPRADVAASDTGTAGVQGAPSDAVGDANLRDRDAADSAEGFDLDDVLLRLALEAVGSGDSVTNYGDCNYGSSNDYDGDCNHVVGNPALAGLPFLITASGGALGGASQIGAQGAAGFGDGDFGTNPANFRGFRGSDPSVALGAANSVGGYPAPLPSLRGSALPQFSDCLVCGPGPGHGPIITPVLQHPPVPLIIEPPPIEIDPTPPDFGENPVGTGGPPILQNVREPHGLLVFGIAAGYLAWLRRRRPGRATLFRLNTPTNDAAAS